MKSALYKFFKIQERGSNLKRELLGGLITFLTMIYIIPVNSAILKDAGISYGAGFLATALSAVIGTLIAGLVANYPVGLAPGMGINAFFAYTVVTSMGFTAGEALATVLISGVIFFIISATKIRSLMLKAIPRGLKAAVGVGIGAFVGFVGLSNAGIIVSHPVTLVQLQDFKNAAGQFDFNILANVLLAFLGIVLVFILGNLKSGLKSYAVIISMAVVALFSGILNLSKINTPGFWTEGMSLSNLQLDTSIWGGFKDLFTNPSHLALLIPVTFAFLFVNFFNTTGTLMAVGNAANLVKEDGTLVDDRKILLCDSAAGVIGACLGTSPVTVFVESATGVNSGARTGLSACVVALLFGISILLYPLFSVFGSVVIDGVSYSPVTSLALVYVASLMFKEVTFIDFKDPAEATAGFITIISMLLCYSITYGITFGFLTYTIVKMAEGKFKDVNLSLYILDAVFIAYLIVDIVIKYLNCH